MKYANVHRKFLIASLLIGILATVFCQLSWIFSSQNLAWLRAIIAVQYGAINGTIFYLTVGHLLAKIFAGPKPVEASKVQTSINLLEHNANLPHGTVVMQYKEIRLPDGRIIRHGEALQIQHHDKI